VIYFDGGCAASPAIPAVHREHPAADRLPAPTTWTADPMLRAAVPRLDQAAASDARAHQSQPISFVSDPMRKGKGLRHEWFTDRAEALEAAGLSE
jgi:hypothetical protein